MRRRCTGQVAEELSQRRTIPICFSGFAHLRKGLASAGSFVCGSAVLKEHLVNHARTFIFLRRCRLTWRRRFARRCDWRGHECATREAACNREAIFRRVAKRGLEYFRDGIADRSRDYRTNGDALDAAEHLQREGFAVRAIRPPTVPEGKARMRFSLTSLIEQMS